MRFFGPPCLLGSPLPKKLFPRPVPSGLPLYDPALLPRSCQGCSFWVCPCGQRSLRVPFPWPLCCGPVHPAVFLVAVFFHGHTPGTTPASCAQPFTGPCPTSDHAFSPAGLSEDLAFSASPFVSAPARSPRAAHPVWWKSKRWRVLYWTCASLAPSSCYSAHLGACCRPWWCLHPRAALLPEQGIFQLTAMEEHCEPAPVGPASRRFASLRGTSLG